MTTTNTPVRAGCYCRISSDPNDKRQGVDRQRKDTTALCEVKGWSPVDFYVDNDRSASNGKERPEWDRLLADIQAGKIDAIAAWDQDRGWRMMHELEALRRFFTGLGRRVPLATTGQGDIDFYSPTGIYNAQMKTAASEHEVAMLKVRIRRTAREKAESGRPQWKQAFGYLPDTRRKEDDDGKRQIDEDAKKLVEQAYRALLAGTSLNGIAAIFNQAGRYGLTGKPWTASTVSLFLRAPRNAGLRSHTYIGEDGRSVTEIVGPGTWPPLVDKPLWDAAMDKLNAPGRAPGKKSVRRHLLTALLHCGKPGCGGYLHGNWQMQAHRGGPRAHAICYTCRACRGVSIRAENIEPQLYKLVGGRLAKDDAVDLLKAAIHDEAEAEAIRAELTALYGELEQIGIDRGKRELTGPQAKIATDVVQADIDALERRQRDQERRRIFEGIPLGKPEAVAAVRELSADRFRAVVAVVARIRVDPVGKGSHVYDPERLKVKWL
jgi:DNA invertase Pin-like site-specific DNA recombinase